MNKRRLVKLAEWLEAGAPEKKGVAGFDMSSYVEVRKCGTVCCLAGAAQCFFDPKHTVKNLNKWWPDWDWSEAAELLGLDPTTADALFHPDQISDTMCWEHIKPKQAARVVRHLIETGKVDWTVFKPTKKQIAKYQEEFGD